jgi:hypothetical protein
LIIKGTSRAGSGALASHLGNAETNERVQLIETRGTLAGDLRGALAEMEAVAAGTQCVKSLYHAAISPAPPHRLTPEQREEAVQALEDRLGLAGHARVVVIHEKHDREHIHVVWSRIDVDRMKAVPDSHNYRAHEEVSRDLERRFGHDRVQGAHVEREGVERPDRTPSRAELRQEERTGISGKTVKAEVTAAFHSSDGAEAFRAALSEAGYTLAKGDRRDLVVVDHQGGIHSLARRLDGLKAADLRAYMAGIDPASVPSIEEAQIMAAERRRMGGGEDHDALLAVAYGRGDDYVTQTRAAQKEHAARIERLNELRQEAEQRDDARRSRVDWSVQSRSEGQSDFPSTEGIEMTDAMHAMMDRLREAKGETSPQADDPGRQNQAPGGGRTRSR